VLLYSAVFEKAGAEGTWAGRIWLGTQPLWGWRVLLGRPGVGLRAAVQPWALGRNPVGIGGRAGIAVSDQGLIDHLLACPYPFEIPPRAKDATRPISL